MKCSGVIVTRHFFSYYSKGQDLSETVDKNKDGSFELITPSFQKAHQSGQKSCPGEIDLYDVLREASF